MSNFKNFIEFQTSVRGAANNKREVWLLVALVLFLLIPVPVTLFPEHSQMIFIITYSLLIIGGIKSVADSKRHIIIGLTLGLLSFIFIWISVFSESGHYSEWFRIISLLFYFLFLAYHVFRGIALFGAINFNTIFASISGYLILGVIGGLLFQLLEISHPGSFNSPTPSMGLFDLNYFSFVTLTTLGFGDITPASQAAKSLTLIVGIAGQLYLTILVAIIIGRLLKKDNQ